VSHNIREEHACDRQHCLRLTRAYHPRQISLYVPCASGSIDTLSQSADVVQAEADRSPSALVGKVGRTCAEEEGARDTDRGVAAAASALLDLVVELLARLAESALAHQRQHRRPTRVVGLSRPYFENIDVSSDGATIVKSKVRCDAECGEKVFKSEDAV
jgi:hypothetical protein